MNVGIQDAANLAWRLADVVEGLRLTRSWTSTRPSAGQLGEPAARDPCTAALRSYTSDGLALRELMAELIDNRPELSKDLAERLSGLAGELRSARHPLAGSRAPDLPLAGSTATLFSALHEARPVIVAVPGFIDDALAAELRGRGLFAQPLGRQERAEWADVTVRWSARWIRRLGNRGR